MGRACLNYWEHAGQFPHMLWRRPFKILFLRRLKKNISLAEVAEVRALLLLFTIVIFLVRVVMFFVVKFVMMIIVFGAPPPPQGVSLLQPWKE